MEDVLAGLGNIQYNMELRLAFVKIDSNIEGEFERGVKKFRQYLGDIGITSEQTIDTIVGFFRDDSESETLTVKSGLREETFKVGRRRILLGYQQERDLYEYIKGELQQNVSFAENKISDNFKDKITTLEIKAYQSLLDYAKKKSTVNPINGKLLTYGDLIPWLEYFKGLAEGKKVEKPKTEIVKESNAKEEKKEKGEGKTKERSKSAMGGEKDRRPFGWSPFISRKREDKNPKKDLNSKEEKDNKKKDLRRSDGKPDSKVEEKKEGKQPKGKPNFTEKEQKKKEEKEGLLKKKAHSFHLGDDNKKKQRE